MRAPARLPIHFCRAAALAATLGVVVVASVLAQDRRTPRGAEQPREFVQVTIQGTLETGIVAIGGETTGTTITAEGMKFELDLSRNPQLAQQAEQLNGKPALLSGRLTRRPGVEIGERWIVRVQQLSAPREREIDRPVDVK